MVSTKDSTVDFCKTCSTCGNELRPQDNFCSNCGKPASTGHAPQQGSPNLMEDHETLRLTNESETKVNVGDIYAGKFRILKLLGSGGMGLVYLAQEENLGANIALKILKPEFSSDVGAITRFQREIRVLARLRHPAIPRIIEWGSQNGAFFFAAEFIAGRNLNTLTQESGPLPADQAAQYIISVAEALGGAHQAGVIHRDIKPANIMIGDDGRIHLIDFGVARMQGSEVTRLTKSGFFMGTPQYMSPEQINSHYTDERSDIYSLGVVFYELLTGELPFTGETPVAIASKHRKEIPTPPRVIKPSIPFNLEQAILRCLEKEPSSRYWTVNELLTDLRRKQKVARIRKRPLPNGDMVTEDPAQRKGAALEISSDHEKVGWNPRVAIYYRDHFYRIKSSLAPDKPDARWQYHLEFWPDNEIMPRVVDYEAEAAMQSANPLGRITGKEVGQNAAPTTCP